MGDRFVGTGLISISLTLIMAVLALILSNEKIIFYIFSMSSRKKDGGRGAHISLLTGEMGNKLVHEFFSLNRKKRNKN